MRAPSKHSFSGLFRSVKTEEAREEPFPDP